jgi:hypothetical protein
MDILRKTLVILDQYRLLLVLFCLGVVIVIASKRIFDVKYDPREPPIISHPIPFIGHVIGMFKHGASYFDFIKYVPLLKSHQAQLNKYL